ncbi:hypothetical protein BLAHAN_04408 [Blautia hansenii DSM 20583]|uniref:Uncharacterized protein n=1 Tax=Blautia hansenii DSM 20583 TaxID=537007 RepID=C9L4V8_BLAHA|nr:hypothetical protein BLAHAN_04408 [Blautia hansenii DSM 20583]
MELFLLLKKLYRLKISLYYMGRYIIFVVEKGKAGNIQFTSKQ